MKGRFALAVAATLLLQACGDDLESRQAVVEEMQGPRELVIPTAKPTGPRSAGAAEQGFDDDGSAQDRRTDEIMIDAEPENLIDDTRGFSADPLDDARGFDPTPIEPEVFAPEPMEPETVED
ncbi:hypothetical protein [Aurantiacibacter poecillastricola]|uniref:hypothetical protein n=1 Tax=Aurantiacibacter poecillastricola TaxID=3064385 RepID=UPI00273FCA0A|nr:hypothetical protein [Aurantiacibacter sp. 219JJ12-13]MDP5263155.1 hypothetical protein [Aurantiacibacter sp. 219JJ12-13]